MAAGLQEHEALGFKQWDPVATRWNTPFRFALKNRASLQDAFQRQQQQIEHEQQEWGHF